MHVRVAAGVLLLAAAPVIHGVPSSAVQTDRPVPFRVGEVLTYDISWSTYLTAGTATLTVRERQQISPTVAVYDIVAEGRPTSWLDKLYHLYYKAESLLNTSTLQPTIATVFSDERKRTKLKTTRFLAPGAIDFQPQETAPRERRSVPSGTVDPLSAIYAIRAATLKAGQTIATAVIDDTTVYTVKWQVAGPETVTAGARGAVSAWRVTPLLFDAKNKPVSDRRIVIWLSNDARRLPVKFETELPVGSFTFLLKAATNP